jgi:hypothetical protein
MLQGIWGWWDAIARAVISATFSPTPKKLAISVRLILQNVEGPHQSTTELLAGQPREDC